MFKTGLYKHFKGGEYLVLGFPQHTEEVGRHTYKAVYECVASQLMYVRPLQGDGGFYEPAIVDGEEVERFTFVMSLSDWRQTTDLVAGVLRAFGIGDQP